MAVAFLCCAAAAGAAETQTLRAAGDAAGIYMGAVLRYAPAFQYPNATYTATHSTQYSLMTSENVCKWRWTQANEGSYTLGECQRAAAYAKQHNQAFRGHNLCWKGPHNPEWLAEITDPVRLEALLRDHVKTVMQGVPGALAWDVVNEAVTATPKHQGDYFKEGAPWYPALPNYVDIAFEAARAADAAPLLFYNDFATEEAGTVKSDNQYAMLQSMVRRGIPIDGVGIQTHIKMDAHMPNVTAIAENIRRIGALGLQVHITEFTVRCPDPCNETLQAEIYAGVLRACLEQREVCRSFETWGFTDLYTSVTGANCPTAACHPLPFDEAYRPKPAVPAMLAVLGEYA
eukprot:TRINITY_DN18384_c0_g1_i1.p1 TRINITY_DN18384_c0_g1~~TRINITY_DN18384_c0_g1_i1.p1  ORF type:complete len:345 (+),score=100.09 TRINITY_DN18384_c0_g1_i1:64-1098(+)